MREKVTSWLLFLILLEGVAILSILLVLAMIRLFVPES